MIIVVNTGSTSTKMAAFNGTELYFSGTVRHSKEELDKFEKVVLQKDFRMNDINTWILENGIKNSDIECVIAIGGLLKKMESGAFEVNQDMIDDLTEAKYGQHAANLSAIIAKEIADNAGVKAYIADPITVDEMQEIARMSGHPNFRRSGRCHTLNQKRIARLASEELGKAYDEVNLVVAHLGGGISIVAHEKGKMIDTSSNRGEGAFSIDRSGAINSWELANLCFSGKYEKDEVLSMLNGSGGIIAYLNLTDFKTVENQKNAGDKLSGEVFNALIYQVTKEIGSLSAVLSGNVDAIVLTGGMSYSKELVRIVKERVGFISNILVYPGENEMLALAEYADGILKDTIKVKEYIKV
ncbi:butyrate kinase [Anaerotignum sp.]|uniref:butyrate kinase n=1 Tax=Anaerotignum sp. TaxID=2039241 RepID=UPI00271532AB|nr:butyrate kinase [Anaerotignum sp.]